MYVVFVEPLDIFKYDNLRRCGGMVDAPDSKSGEGNLVRVRVSPALPSYKV